LGQQGQQFTFFGLLRDRDAEQAFSNENWRVDRKKTRFATLAISLLFALFFYQNYREMGPTSELAINGALRLSGLVLLWWALIMTRQKDRPKRFGQVLGAGVVLMFVAMIGVMEVAHYSLHTATSSLVAMMIFFYVFMPAHVGTTTAAASLLAFGFGALYGISPEGLVIQAVPSMVVGLATMGLGLVHVIHDNKLHRENYTLHSREKDANQVLREEIATRETLEHELRSMALTDHLTGIFNRRHFLERASEEVARARRYGHTFSIAMMDLDHFKNINDQYGHAAGDEALRAFSAFVSKSKREMDIFGRLGGEEFALIMPDTEVEIAKQVCERMREGTERIRLRGLGGTISMTVSTGLADYCSVTDSLDSLLARADKGLYEAKHDGRNRVVYAAKPDKPDDEDYSDDCIDAWEVDEITPRSN